jgi:hypothetical protein
MKYHMKVLVTEDKNTPVSAMDTYGSVKVYPSTFLTLETDGGEWPVSRSGNSTPRERAPSIYCIGG